MADVLDILRNVEMRVDVARTTHEALVNISLRFYDVVISDMERDGVRDEGQRFLCEAVKLGINRPTTHLCQST